MNTADLHSLLTKIGIRDLREGNEWINGLCPYHIETRPSWGVSLTEPHFFNCFGCKAKGPLRQLLIDIGGLTPTLAEQLAAKPGPIQSRDLWLEADERPARELDPSELYPFDLPLVAKIYLRQRRINAITAEKLGLVYDPKLNRILFPWFVGRKEFNVKLFGVTGRTVLENDPLKMLPMFGTMKGQSLYLPDRRILRSQPLVLVEGEADAALVWQSGYRNVAATGFGTFTLRQSQIVLGHAREVVCFTDDDEAGELLYQEIVKKLVPTIAISRVNYDRVLSDRDRLKKKYDPAELYKKSPPLLKIAIEEAEKNSDFPSI